ncbi:TonB-dependent receptor [Novosphingobium profundi]|uniref:TonB-dependent receptor n=1 Tax=Novosphingobium profundi TaxID=1774954 RepID=UPI001CFC72A7|nr:TonB-dependent receptor [Novosphingobium profundi]
MLKTDLVRSSALAALSVGLMAGMCAPALAQTAPVATADAAATGAVQSGSDTIIVTGSTRAERRFDVSYAVNTLDDEEIAKIAPVNLADLVGQVPGFQTEITGGEVQNIYRVRGLPSDGVTSFQQDGLTVFHENDGYFWRGDAAIKYDLMTERVEVVRGGPAPIYASRSGAIVNQITVTGSDVSRGKAQVTLGDTGLYRLDAMQSGPLGEDTYYAIGGFLRHHDGYRDNGFPNDRGGQVRANIKHDFDNGSVKVTANYVNDHNVFYLPIPISDPRDPSVSLDPYIDYFKGTMNSPAFRNVNLRYQDGNGNLQSRTGDLADGRHMRLFNFGVQYEGDFDGWLVSAKAGYTQGKLDFDAFYSTTNPADADEFAAGYADRASAAWGAPASLGYVLAGTNTAYDPYGDSGLVMQGQYRNVASKFYSAQGDLSVAKRFDTGIGSHDLKVGVYASAYGEDKFQLYQNYLIQVAGQPATLDLVAYDAQGGVMGRVTDNGALNVAATLNAGDSDGTVIAFYANDTWELAPGLRIDAGIRHERYSFDGWAANTVQVNLGDDTTLADDMTRAFDGTIVNGGLSPNATNWTVGANYDFSSQVGIYGRASHMETPNNVQVAMSINPTIATTKIDQFEAGLKLAFGQSYLYVTGFYTNYDPYNASFLAFDPTTGRNDVNVPFVGEAQVKGIEFDGAFKPVPWFTLNAALTVSDPQYKNFQNTNGADPELAEGKQITRQPKVYGNIRPSFDFTAGETDISVYGRYTYQSKRYVDIYNNTALPSFGTVGAGVTVRHGRWSAQVVGDNLFNEKGLTEGNTRTDSISGQGSSEAIYGRPIFGRNVRLIVGVEW